MADTLNGYQNSFDTQSRLFATNATKSKTWRLEQLDAVERMLTENRERLEDAISQDFKTASQEKAFEVDAPIAVVRHTRQELEQWMSPVEARLPRFLVEAGFRGKIYREPYGVTLIMGPFNGPLTLLLDPAIAALAAGNPCMLKLHEALTHTSSLLLDLIPRYFSADCVCAVLGGRDVVTELLKLPFNFIFCTGSVSVGKVVMRAAAEHLTPVLLELGGQNPAIVDETADVEAAARKIVWGATAWGGQWCTSPGYAYVHSSVATAFVEACRKAVVEFYGPDPRSNPDYSRIISPQAVDRLAGLIDSRKVVAGGHHDSPQRYLDPTVLYPVVWSDPIMDEEIFGPILPVLTYDALGGAILEIKARAKPLAAYIFSRDQGAIDRFIQEVSFGGGAVNQTNVQLFVDTLPFGGVGNSGIGRYYGKAGFDSLTNAKSVLVSPSDREIEHLFPPYTDAKVAALSQWFEY